MMTYEEALSLIEFQKQQISDLQAENTRLRNESANSSEAVILTSELNGDLSSENNNMRTSFEILGINEWVEDKSYILDEQVRYDGELYKCVQAHTSQSGWEPDITPALWTKRSLDEWPEWVQPTGTQDAYQTGDKVSHNDYHWISSVDNNVWEPGVYGWYQPSYD